MATAGVNIDRKQSPDAAWIADLRRRFPTERTVDEALTRKMRERSGPPYAPTSLAEIARRIERFVAAEMPGAMVSDVRPLGGGASKEQYRFDVTENRGGASHTYVLRREPPESIVETHRLREYQMMRALGPDGANVVPIPPVVGVDPDGRWFGRPAMISAFVSGVAKPPEAGGNVTGLGTDFSPEMCRIIAPQFVDMLARIHAFDWRTANLDAFDALAADSTDGVMAIINWWDRVWEEDSVEGVPLVKFAAHWLRANAPPIARAVVVHNDYRAGNFLFDPDSAEFTAILDWELTHIGDYHEDLAWTMQEGYGYIDAAGMFQVCGLIAEDEFLARYAAATGFAVDRRILDYYLIMAAWKSTIMVYATAVRCAMGGKSHQDVVLSWIASFGNVTIATLEKLLRREIARGS